MIETKARRVTCRLKHLFFSTCSILSVYTGIENIEYFGGSVNVETCDIVFSIITYTSWSILFVISVLTDRRKVAKKTILGGLLLIYIFACFGGLPYIIAFAPLMGIAMAFISGMDQFVILSLLYFGWIIMVELTDLINVYKQDNTKKGNCE